jgi:glycine oxidase
VVGATVEERGFDTTVTVGAVHELLESAVALVPGVAELELRDARAGLRPATPDNAPIIGPVRGVPGVVVATGHYRNGILLTPVTADAVADLVTSGTIPEAAAPFGLERFG